MPREKRSGAKPKGPSHSDPNDKIARPPAPSVSSLSAHSLSSTSSWASSRASSRQSHSHTAEARSENDLPPAYSPPGGTTRPDGSAGQPSKDDASTMPRRSRKAAGRSRADSDRRQRNESEKAQRRSEAGSTHPADDNQLVPFGPYRPSPNPDSGDEDPDHAIELYSPHGRLSRHAMTHYKAPTVESPAGTPQVERYRPIHYDPKDWVTPRRSRSSRRAIEYPPRSSGRGLHRAAMTEARPSRRSRSVMTPSEYGHESRRSRNRAVGSEIEQPIKSRKHGLPIAELLGAATGGAVVLISGGNPGMALLGAAAGTFAGNRFAESRKEKKLKLRAAALDLEKGESLRSRFNHDAEKHRSRSQASEDGVARHGSHSRSRGQYRHPLHGKSDSSDDGSVYSASTGSYISASSSASSRRSSVQGEKDYFSAKHHPGSQPRSLAHHRRRQTKPAHPLAADDGWDSEATSESSGRYTGSAVSSRHSGSTVSSRHSGHSKPDKPRGPNHAG